MIHLSPDVARLARVPYPTTRWCGDCGSYFVLLPSKEGLACKCRYVVADPVMVDLTGMGERDGELAAGEVRGMEVGAEDRGPASLRASVRRLQGSGEAGGLE